MNWNYLIYHIIISQNDNKEKEKKYNNNNNNQKKLEKYLKSKSLSKKLTTEYNHNFVNINLCKDKLKNTSTFYENRGLSYKNNNIIISTSKNDSNNKIITKKYHK